MFESERETILNGTNSLKIHPHTVHLISMKMQNKKKSKNQTTTKATSNTYKPSALVGRYGNSKLKQLYQSVAAE